MTNIKDFIPSELYDLAKIFASKTPLYIVGGFIRDSIEYNTAPQDIDLSSSLTPQEITELLRGTKYKVFEASLRLGTLIIKGKRAYEYTTFRQDSYPNGSGMHAPDAILFTKELEVDAKRRDFKCNAIYYDILSERIIDPLNGIEDIERKLISTTIDPFEVLSQDGLRILRLIRMVSNLGYEVETRTLIAAKELHQRLKDISKERIQVELTKILSGKNVYKALCLLKETKALDIIIPELVEADGCKQNEKYHKYDVLEHTFKTVEVAPVKIRLAALLHDVAKPYCLKTYGNMYKHAVVGSKMAHDILKRLRFSNDEIKMVVELVGAHMFDLNDTAKVYTIRKYITEHHHHIEDIIDLQTADAIGTGLISGPLRPSKTREQLIIMRERNIPFCLKDLKINGSDVTNVGFKGEQVGEILQEILDVCLTENIKNDREELLSYLDRKWRKLNG